MAMTGLEAFDTTIHKSNAWLNELMDELRWQDKRRTYQALRATFHALRDRLPVEEVAQLAAQLPMLLRGMYYEGWDPTDKPFKLRHKEEFLSRIEQELPNSEDIDVERVAQGVLALLQRHVSQGEIEDVAKVLPSEVRELWPS